MTKFQRHPASKAFERAFSTRTSGARRECPCGRIFYNPNGGWDWDDGELESLGKNAQATGLDYAVGEIDFEGVGFCIDCECWHERALRMLNWIVAHDEAIAEFLSEEKKRKTREANRSPVVEG
jgi:hypothetical protein